MTDKEKFDAVVNYIKGVCNGAAFTASLNIKHFNEFLESLNK